MRRIPALRPAAVLAVAFGAAAALVHDARASDEAASGRALAAGIQVVGDAIPRPIAAPGDATRGREIVAQRQVGLCLLCHPGPFPQERFQGDIAPDLAGAGRRWTEGQLRLRIVDARRVNPATTMPSYHRVEGFERVAPAWRDRPILTAQQVEDVVAFLLTLR